MHRELVLNKPGSDTAVLMIHGIAGTPAHFREFLPLIPEEWSVYNLLLDGHGGSVEDFAHSSMEKWKRQVNGRLEEILSTHTRVLLVAHSMGTLFSIQAAMDHPDRIPALFLIGCPLRVRYPLKTMLLSTRAALGKKDRDAENMRNDCSIQLSPKLWKYIRWLPRFWELLVECRRIRRALPGLCTPAVCFQSRKDELVSMRTCKALAENQSVRTEILEESGHFAYSPGDMQRMKEQLAQMIRCCF